jgi:hypothetical protein
MKTFAFNLLPQKSRTLVKKEEGRDDYGLLVTIFPLLGVIVWLLLILVDGLVVDNYQQVWKNTIEDRKNTIDRDLSAILIRHGELVQKTNALNMVIEKDVKPEELFLLLDQIYANQDSTFNIVGYGRKNDGSFLVNIVAQDHNRFSEITRRFSSYKYINNVKIENSTFNEKANNVAGTISFFFNYIESSATK